MPTTRVVHSLAGATSGIIGRFLRSPRGAAAVEFAFIAPVLLTLYFMTMEISQGIETNKKVGRVASMVADLVTQQQEIDEGSLEAIMKIGKAILQPYNRSKPEITVTAVEMITGSPPTVVWSRKLVDNEIKEGFKAGDPFVGLPDKVNVNGTFLVTVEAYLSYTPVILWTAEQKTTLGLASAFDNLSMRETYYLRPRVSSRIPCTDC